MAHLSLAHLSLAHLSLTIGVCVPTEAAPNVPRVTSYPRYIHEILGHAGLAYRAVEEEALVEALPRLWILVIVGEANWPEATRCALRGWVEQGGSLLSIGGVAGMPDLFGVKLREPEYAGAAWGGNGATLGEGYLQITETTHPALAGVSLPLHFFNGIAVNALEGGEVQTLASFLDAHQRLGPYAPVVERQVGSGRCFLIAPDAVGAIVRIQQGIGVTRDGVAAPDGTGSVTDGVLKCDDGAVLDWSFDRQPVPGAPGLRCFLEPIADHWRSLILRAIFYLADRAEVPIALLWLYPRNLPALAHLSHDSDHNDPARALSLLEVTRELGVSATWCIILPGYDPEIIDAIRDGGHELAMHYDALEHEWSEAEFGRQWEALCAQFGERPVSNKNHYTRWQGDTELFEWCLRRDIRIDGTKGPSKVGEAGFVFGSCHPYFPMAPGGELIDVLELPFLTQDMESFIPAAITAPFVCAVLQVHGIMHLLFHPNLIELPGVADALRGAVRQARAAGMEWWTTRQIAAWERARRAIRWEAADGDTGLRLVCAEPLQEATLLILNPSRREIVVDGCPQTAADSTRWGFPFSAVTLDLEPALSKRLDFGVW